MSLIRLVPPSEFSCFLASCRFWGISAALEDIRSRVILPGLVSSSLQIHTWYNGRSRITTGFFFFFWYMRKNGCVSCTASSENLEGGSKESTFRSGRGKSCLGPRIPWREKRRGREATSTTQPLVTAAPCFYLSRIVLYLSQFLLNSFLSIWGVYLAILSLLVLSAPTCPTAVPSVFCDFKRRGGEGSRILFVCLLFSP